MADVVPLPTWVDTERRERFTRLARAEAEAVAGVEAAARWLLRGEREGWFDTLMRSAREDLAKALNRLDVARALLAPPKEGACPATE